MYKPLVIIYISLLLISIFQLKQVVFADEDLRLPRIIISSGGPYQANSSAIQNTQDDIFLPPEYFGHPLSLVASNGSENTPGYSWVRVFLLPDSTDSDLQNLSQPVGRLLVNENSFLNDAQIYLDLSGQLQSGKNKILVEAAGQKGSSFSWELRSIGIPHLYEAQEITAYAGQWLSLSGSGFSSRPQENNIQIGNFNLVAEKSNFNSVQVFIPNSFPAGYYDLAVSIRSFKSRIIKLNLVNEKKQN